MPKRAKYTATQVIFPRHRRFRRCRRGVIADKLVEDAPAHLEIFVDLDVDQSAVEDEVSVRAAH
jgi:hypothetical protein